MSERLSVALNPSSLTALNLLRQALLRIEQIEKRFGIPHRSMPQEQVEMVKEIHDEPKIPIKGTLRVSAQKFANSRQY